MKLSVTVLLIFFSFLANNSFAQNENELTLESIYKFKEFSSDRFGPFKWLHGGDSYTTIEKTKDGQILASYNTVTGEKNILVASERLIPQGNTRPIKIENYFWSNDHKKLLIYTNSKKVWRRNTRGDYWILNLETWNLKKLGGTAEPSTLMFAKFSPDDKNVGYVIKNNIFVENLSDGKIAQLTFDGSDTIINGTFDWVYEEELGLRDGFRWSPDGSKIAFWHSDAEGVGIFYMINNTDSIYSKIIPVQYPKVGTTNSAVKLGVADLETSRITWVDLQGDSRNYYLARMEWAANSDEIIFQKLNREQNTLSLFYGNSSTGKVNHFYTDIDSAWIEACDDFKWINNGSDFTWSSDKDGWKHIYSISRDGKNEKLLTPGQIDIVSVELIDTKNNCVYFIASPHNAAQRFLFKSPLTGKPKIELVTPKEFSGTNSYDISPNGIYAFHTYSNTNTPPVRNLISLPDHKRIRNIYNNEKLASKLLAFKGQRKEFFKTDIGNIELDCWMIKPYNFDPDKKYPVLVYVYGEPHGSTVRDVWSSGDLWHHMIAQNGYIILSIENRGVIAPRGRDFRKFIAKKLGILAPKDQADAVQRIIKDYSFIDEDRIGVWGWSGGGSMTLHAMLQYPDIYKVGIAIAFLSDIKYYDTIYEERYMGTTTTNPTGYRDGSPITYANNLKGKLLLVHGTGDDNVHYQNFEAMVNEFIKFNKQFDIMIYPNRTHSIRAGRNTTLHLRTLMTNYIYDNLPAGGI